MDRDRGLLPLRVVPVVAVTAAVFCEDCETKIPLGAPGHETHAIQKKFAEFIFYWENTDMPPVPYYNVHGLPDRVDDFGPASMDANMVIRLGVKLPPTPSFEDWKASQ